MQGSLSKLRTWELDHKQDDIRGWMVRDSEGRPFGRVSELVIDTDQQHVTEVVLADGQRFAAHDISIGDNVLMVTRATDSGVAELEPERRDVVDTSPARDVIRSDGEGEDVVVSLIAEDVEFGKRTIDNGTARVQVRVRERPFEHPLKLREETVSVERRKVDEVLDAADAEARLRDQSVEVSAIHEYPVTEKHTRVVEEVVLSKKVEERSERLKETVRHTSVDVHELRDDGYDLTHGAKS